MEEENDPSSPPTPESTGGTIWTTGIWLQLAPTKAPVLSKSLLGAYTHIPPNKVGRIVHRTTTNLSSCQTKHSEDLILTSKPLRSKYETAGQDPSKSQAASTNHKPKAPYASSFQASP